MGKMKISRRTLIVGTGTGGFLALAGRAEGNGQFRARFSSRSRLIKVDGARLYCLDSGGTGAPLMLAHPHSGSAVVWAPQFMALARAGFRVVAWSRRGHAGTVVEDPDDKQDRTQDDINALADALGFRTFHALGSAAGGGIMLDYTISNPGRIDHLIVACAICNIAEPEYQASCDRLRPPAFSDLPLELRELGPEFRAREPEGTARWLALAKAARPDAALGHRWPPPPAPRTRWSALESIRRPVHWIAGGADLIAPPAIMRQLQAHVPHSRLEVIENAGHSAHWEEPDAFNDRVIGCLRRMSDPDSVSSRPL